MSPALCRVCEKPMTPGASGAGQYTDRRRSFRRHRGCVEKERPCKTCGRPVAMTPSRRWKLATGQIANAFCSVGCNNSHNKRGAGQAKPWTLKGLLKHIRHQAARQLEDGHGYRMMLAVTIIEIDGRLGEPQEDSP